MRRKRAAVSVRTRCRRQKNAAVAEGETTAACFKMERQPGEGG